MSPVSVAAAMKNRSNTLQWCAAFQVVSRTQSLVCGTYGTFCWGTARNRPAERSCVVANAQHIEEAKMSRVLLGHAQFDVSQEGIQLIRA